MYATWAFHTLDSECTETICPSTKLNFFSFEANVGMTFITLCTSIFGFKYYWHLIPPIQRHNLTRTRAQSHTQLDTIAETADWRREEVVDRSAARRNRLSVSLNALRYLLRDHVKVCVVTSQVRIAPAGRLT